MTVENILNNEKLLQALAAVQTAKELEAVLAEHNIKLAEDLSAEEVLQMLKNPGKDGELNEAELEDVNGGLILPVTGPYYGVNRVVIWVIAQIMKKRNKK